MKATIKWARQVLGLLAILAWLFIFTAAAGATPNSLSPANGARISSSAQTFSWLDNNDYGPLDHWYLEISTDPLTDSWGYFWTLPVYASPNLGVSSVNLNAIGRALPPGTYYWHVLGYYGPYGSLGTAWSLPVQSFTVYNPAAAPKINVTPVSLYFSAQVGGVAAPQSLFVSNSGGGTLLFQAARDLPSTWMTVVLVGNTGQIAELGVSVSTAALGPGTYNGQVGVWDNGSSPPASPSLVLIPVTFQVFAPDPTPPTGTLAINNGAATAGVTATLNVFATDGAGSGLDKMSFKDDGGAWSNWYDYDVTAPWRFSGASGTKKVWARFKDKVGNVSTAVSDTIIVVDTVAPTAPAVNAPTISTNVSKKKIFNVGWGGATDAAPSSGIASYDVQVKKNSGGAWAGWKAGTAATSATWTGAPGNTYYFRARAKDGAGNVGAWSAEAKTIVPLDQSKGIVKRAGFAGTISKASSKYYLGTVRYSTTKGDIITYSFTGNYFALIGTKGPKFSKAVVIIDGVKKTIDAKAAKNKFRQVLMEKNLAMKKHTIKIRNLGTAGRNRFEIDANAVGK